MLDFLDSVTYLQEVLEKRSVFIFKIIANRKIKIKTRLLKLMNTGNYRRSSTNSDNMAASQKKFSFFVNCYLIFIFNYSCYPTSIGLFQPHK